MKIKLIALFILVCSFSFCNNFASATTNSQMITIKNGWNIVSTPRIVESHNFSIEENSNNFDIYILDPNSTSKWTTMSQLNQTEFTPLFGYFINNKTGQDQTLTLNYKNNLLPNERIFEREFSKVGWYSVGGANPTYIKTQNANVIDSNNVNQVFDSVKDKMDLFIDFTDQDYTSNRKSVAINTNWKSAISNDLNSVNDIRETKGYAVYINDASAKLMGFQNNDIANATSLLNYNSGIAMASQLKKSDSNKIVLATQVEANNSNIIIKSVEVNLSGTSIQPWKTFDSFGLYIDNQLIKSIDVTQSSFVENVFGTDYTLNFADLQTTIQKDVLTDLTIKVNVKSNPDNTSNYTFKFLEGSIKGEDSLGITKLTNTIILNDIAIDCAGDSIIVLSLNANSPKAGFVTGSATVVSSDKPLAIYDIKAENRDVTIKTLLVTMTDADTIVSAVKLYDGTTLLASVAGANGDVTFDNLAILIAKDTTKTLTVKVDLKPLTAEGKLIKAVVTGSAAKVSAFDSTDAILGSGSCGGGECITGTATGKTLTAYTKAPVLTLVSTSITKTVQAGQADQADATIIFDLTATGGDIFVDTYAHVAGTVTVDDGIAGSDTFAGGLGTYTFSSTAELGSATSYKIASGQTARFTISGHVIDIATTGYLHMAMDKLIWGTAVGTPTTYNLLGISATVNYDLSGFKTTDVSLTRV